MSYDAKLLYLDPVAFGLRIYVARRKLGLSRAKLAEKLGVTVQAIGRWERGETIPNCSLLAELCFLLEMTLCFLFTGMESLRCACLEV